MRPCSACCSSRGELFFPKCFFFSNIIFFFLSLKQGNKCNKIHLCSLFLTCVIDRFYIYVCVCKYPLSCYVVNWNSDSSTWYCRRNSSPLPPSLSSQSFLWSDVFCCVPTAAVLCFWRGVVLVACREVSYSSGGETILVVWQFCIMISISPIVM